MSNPIKLFGLLKITYRILHICLLASIFSILLLILNKQINQWPTHGELRSAKTADERNSILRRLPYINVRGEVDVTNTVEISGQVSIDDISSEVDVNIAKINGWPAANYPAYSLDDGEYHSLGVK